eukprot:58158_1
MIFRVIVYYFQSLSQLLNWSGAPVYLPILSILSMFGDFSINFDFKLGTSSNGVCIIPRLNAMTEIIWALIFIYFIIFHSSWISLVIVLKRFRKTSPVIENKTTPVEENKTTKTVRIKCYELVDFFDNRKP